MRRYFAMGMACAAMVALAGCFNEVDNSVEERLGESHEHVIVHYMQQSLDGADGNAAEGDPMRRLTVTSGYVVIESYQGGTILVPMERLFRLNWRPNPNPPVPQENR